MIIHLRILLEHYLEQRCKYQLLRVSLNFHMMLIYWLSTFNRVLASPSMNAHGLVVCCHVSFNCVFFSPSLSTFLICVRTEFDPIESVLSCLVSVNSCGCRTFIVTFVSDWMSRSFRINISIGSIYNDWSLCIGCIVLTCSSINVKSCSII